MAHSEHYKVPPGFPMGTGDVAELQETLIHQYNFLSLSYNKLDAVNHCFQVANHRSNTDALEDEKTRCQNALQTDRDDTVELMAKILKAGALPLPPVDQLDADVSEVLRMPLLHDAAVIAAGGQAAVDAFAVAAVNAAAEAAQKAEADAYAMDLAQAAEANTKAAAEAEAKAKADAEVPSAAAGRRRRERQAAQEPDPASLERRRLALEKISSESAKRRRKS